MESIKEFNRSFSYIKKYLGEYKKNRNLSRIFTILETILELLIPVSYTHLTLPTNREV